ncbi:copper chaperone PCu(A)C [Bacteriovorax sp. PP10]|uniref:Copper chaperone PCu(A)C n=1 Tax=Bacteriovorax antarcticus TaxID=3088717 RepID=A0ABU5VWJ8_9BACT|nr:copper chaperone PCu(A)C [Bacteriovorax sp. PP10]MEA9357327.1 copper chaperone PCu(A)C [Bacteriovorax sp. PP10]
MKKIILTLSLVLSVNLFAADIEVKDASIKPTLPGMQVTAIFMKLINNTDKDIKLMKVTGDFAGTFELHNMEMAGGKMVMRPVDFILLKSKSMTELKSGGLHVMVFDVKGPIMAGSEYKAKLVLDNNKEVFFTAKSLEMPAHHH